MEIGVIVPLNKNVEAEIKKVHNLGLKECQLNGWDPMGYTEQDADAIKKACNKYGVRVTTFWCGWSGPCVWNFTDGPSTIGLVPEAYRMIRMKELIKGAEFAKKIGVKNVATHCGFIPENPNTTEFTGFVNCIRNLAEQYNYIGQNFLFETGQETPTTLCRVIETVNSGNLGINLDTANLILYGKGNPVDALDVIGKYIMNLHIKDGFYPTNGTDLGREIKVGEGKVNFPLFIKKLKETGYDGPMTIEREISGDEQIKDIKDTIDYLRRLI